MHHPVDYKITVGQKNLIFRMFEGGCQSTISKDDYATIVKRLFLAFCGCEDSDITVQRMQEVTQTAPDLVSYNVLSKLGNEKLRDIAANQEERIGSWFRQEAGILEINDHGED